MAVSLTETIHKLGKSLAQHCQDGEGIREMLCAALAPLLAPSFEIGFVGVRTPAGDVLIEQALIIYTRPPQVRCQPDSRHCLRIWRGIMRPASPATANPA